MPQDHRQEATPKRNSFDQSGFVVCPGASFLLNTINPLADRPDCRSPFVN
jgi:hypothetical protein